MTKKQIVKIIRQTIKKNIGGRTILVGGKVYEDGFTSFDITLEGHGEHDLEGLVDLQDVDVTELPTNGVIDLYLYYYESDPKCSDCGPLDQNAYVEFKDGNIVSIFVDGAWNETTETCARITFDLIF